MRVPNLSSTWLFTLLSLLLLLGACDDGGKDAGSDDAPSVEDPVWSPGVVLASQPETGPRGLLDLRGLIHEHSVNSGDACDGEPRLADGGIDVQCDEDFRAGMCLSRHDFVMLTDHKEFFAQLEFPELLLYREALGDELLERDGAPVANLAACPSGQPFLTLAGTESGLMAVGMERHVGDSARREMIHGQRTTEAIEALQAAEGVVILAHTEEVTPDELMALPVDGFEMFNLHANAQLDPVKSLALLAVVDQPDRLPHPDLVFINSFAEDPAYLETWGSVLARGGRHVTTMGTDAHRNTFDIALPDGERLDSYRRMNAWFSNHLLVQPDDDGDWNDRDLKDALRGARLYGVFEYLGYAAGFDYHATVGDETHEMGALVSLADGVSLVVSMPSLRGLDPQATPPLLTVRLLRAIEGGWDEVASAQDDLSFEPQEPGAYRAEVRMRPRHLANYLNDSASKAEEDFVWIYANAIHVAP